MAEDYGDRAALHSPDRSEALYGQIHADIFSASLSAFLFWSG
jgi:hypothetical protein